MSENLQTVPGPDDSELRFRTLFDSAAEFIFVIDPDGYITLTNRYVTEQSGYSPGDLSGRHIKDFFTDASRQLCECNFPTLRSKGHTRAETEFVCKDGRILQMECVATAIPDRRGEYTSFLIMQRDITERKRTAAALADSESKFRAIFNSTIQFIGVLSPDGILLEANKAALEFAGITDKEVVGRPFWDTAWWQGLEEEQQRLKSAIERASRGELVRYETVHNSMDGNIIHIDFSLKPVLNELGETVFIIPEGRDITERRRAEDLACQHQRESAQLMRLSVMGEMAASIAHELNQPLTALISYCGTALSQLENHSAVPDGFLEMLTRANEQAHHASRIIQHIRNFVTKGTTNRKLVEIDQIIQEMSRLLDWELCNSDITLTLDPGCPGQRVVANSVQIEQVVLNLVRNSIEAIQNAGIQTGNIVVKTRQAGDRSLVISVTDNGPGIEPAMRDHLFEPFRTSKETGMGMGLSISRSIIQSHQGKIWQEQSDPQGAVFCIVLPRYGQDHD
jgi:two-component system sensor kinase FixL